MTRLRFPKPSRSAPKPKRLSRKAKPRRRRKGTRSALKRKCDRLWSLIIRASNGGKCKLAGQDHVRCGGPIQGAHCFGRGHHSVRHELWNGWPLCAGHHVYYTNNPEQWQAMLRRVWTSVVYVAHWTLAQEVRKPDYAAIAANLSTVLEKCA